MQRAVAWALKFTFFDLSPASLLDLGASEGTFCKATTALSEGRIHTLALDPNAAMKRKFHAGGAVDGARFIHAAISCDGNAEPFIDEDEQVPYYDFSTHLDCVVEMMVFQFLGVEREPYVEMIARCLGNDGIFICCEKFNSEDKDIYIDNEIKKDQYKSQFFSEEELIAKYEEILKAGGSGMSHTQVSHQTMEVILSRHFRFNVGFWDSGNFKGYASSNSDKYIREFVDNLPDLDSSFSTRKTPFRF